MKGAQEMLRAVGLSLALVVAAPADPPKQDKPAEEKPALKQADPAPVTKLAEHRPTLVQRDETGRVVRLTSAPAEAALAVMALRAESRRAAERIIADKNAELDKFTRANVAAAAKVHEARAAGRSSEATRLVSEMWDRNKELRARAGLAQEMMAFMSQEEATELRRLVQEYLQARIEEESAAAKAKYAKFDPREFIRSEQVQLLTEDLMRSYERVVQKHAKDLDATLQPLGLTPEQDGKAHRMAADAQQQAYGEMDATMHADLLRRIMAILNDKQRAALLERLGHPADSENTTAKK